MQPVQSFASANVEEVVVFNPSLLETTMRSKEEAV